MIGNRYGKLVVSDLSDRKRHYKCKCDCGREVVVLKYNLLKGNSTSCGCVRLKQKGLSTKYPSEHSSWAKMIRRCTNQDDRSYKDYGGRGIKVCEPWRNSFEQFLKDMGPRPSMLYSIDRINNDGDYEPSNCRWATRKTQANNCRKNHYVTYKGETLSLAEVSDKYGIARTTLINRVNLLGWSIEDAIEKDHFAERHYYNGKFLTLPEISKLTGIKYATLRYRLKIAKQEPEVAFRP